MNKNHRTMFTNETDADSSSGRIEQQLTDHRHERLTTLGEEGER